jgi:carbonic anhydrase
LLIKGNVRYTSNNLLEHDRSVVQNELTNTQYPFASVLGCSDSRVAPEIIFDQNLGDIFSVRLAGNVASKDAIGSLEFSTEYLGTKIIIVMGHTSCGAIKAACDDFKGGNIGKLIDDIRDAVKDEKTIINPDERNSGNTNFVDKVCWINVQNQIQQILKDSPVIQKQVKAKQVGLVGAVLHLNSGQVEFDLKNALI